MQNSISIEPLRISLMEKKGDSELIVASDLVRCHSLIPSFNSWNFVSFTENQVYPSWFWWANMACLYLLNYRRKQTFIHGNLSSVSLLTAEVLWKKWHFHHIDRNASSHFSFVNNSRSLKPAKNSIGTVRKLHKNLKKNLILVWSKYYPQNLNFLNLTFQCAQLKLIST